MKVYDPAAVARDAVAAHEARPAMAVVHDAPDARLVVFRLAAGQAVPVHTSVSSVVLHVLSGSGFVSGADGERDVHAGMVVAYEPREPHGMRAQTEEMIVLAVIAPRPASRQGPLE
jgi:quercetin dioxygenase-like cupin family protein